MSLEREIKEALMRRVSDVQPELGSFGTVEAKVRRAHQRRLAAMASFSIIAIAVAATSIPLLRSGEDHGFAEPGGDIIASPGRELLWAEGDGWFTILPKTWTIRAGFHTVDLNPIDVVDTAPDQMFSITIDTDGQRGTPRTVARVASTSETTVAGRPGVITDGTDEEGRPARAYVVEWSTDLCSACASSQPLRIWIVASDRGTWDRFIDEADAIIGDMGLTRDGTPVGRVRTPAGVIDARVTYDDDVALLVMWLEARVALSTPERFMDDQASDFEELTSYPSEDPDVSFSFDDYSVETCSTHTRRTTCEIRIGFTDADHGEQWYARERVIIGSGRSEADPRRAILSFETLGQTHVPPTQGDGF